MNYLLLKHVVEGTIASFRCKSCGAAIAENNVGVLGTAGNAANLEITCPACKLTGVVKAEVSPFPVAGAAIADAIRKASTTLIHTSEPIRDEDVLKIRKDVESSASVQDLFRQ